MCRLLNADIPYIEVPLKWDSTVVTKNVEDTCKNISALNLAFFWAAAPKGSMTYAFKHMGNFLLLLLLLLLLRTPPPPSLHANISA